MRTGVAVGKLAHFKFAKTASRQEALQTIFPSLLDIFYHPIFDFFEKNRLFQQPPDFPTPILTAASDRIPNGFTGNVKFPCANTLVTLLLLTIPLSAGRSNFCGMDSPSSVGRRVGCSVQG